MELHLKINEMGGNVLKNYISILESLKTNAIELQPIELQSLITFMIENIGNTDPYIRDTLIYSGFCELILNEKVTLEQVTNILQTCIDDEHLYLNIHQNEQNDAVFVRSFSALVIALILYKDSENRFLPEALIQTALKKSGNYLSLETDYRGYVEKKGWAHAVAHGSDLLAQVILHPLFDSNFSINQCIMTLQKCLNTNYAYIDEEEERMLPVIDALVQKGLSDEQLKNWLMNLSDIEENDDLIKYRKQWNVKKFMFTLYAHLLRTKKCEETSNWIYNNFILRESI